MDEETIFYISVTFLISAIGIFGLGGFGSLAIAGILFIIFTWIMILIINYADFLVFPLVTRIFKLRTIPAKNYYIPPAQSCIIKNVNGIYYAVGYITANVYNYVFSAERPDTDDIEMLSGGPEKWERIIMNVRFPFKYHLITAAEDIQQYREDLEARRGAIEFQLSKEMMVSNPSQMAIDDFQRRINVLQARIDKLSTGERPINSIMYIETTAFGVSEKAAIDSLEDQVHQLQTVFNSFNLSISRVVGRELYLLFKFNYVVPPTVQAMKKVLHEQS